LCWNSVSTATHDHGDDDIYKHVYWDYGTGN